MMYSARARTVGVAVEEAELVGQVVVQRAGPRGHVLHRVVLAVRLLAQGRAAGPVALRRRIRPSRRPCRRTRSASPPSSSVGRRLGGPASSVSASGVAVSRRSTRTGFSISSWSIRSCNAISGSCKISIDWIMRGAMRSRMSVRICCEVSRRMVLDSAAKVRRVADPTVCRDVDRSNRRPTSRDRARNRSTSVRPTRRIDPASDRSELILATIAMPESTQTGDESGRPIQNRCRPLRASASISLLANSRALPEARPRASRVIGDAGVGQPVGDEQRGAVAFEVRVGGQDHLADRRRSGPGPPARRGSVVRGRSPEAGRAGRAGRGRRPGRCPPSPGPAGRAAARPRRRPPGRAAGRGRSAQSGWSASVRWKQVWQWRTWSLASRIASARARASSAGHFRMWWASRSAVLAPMPGRRPNASISRSTAPEVSRTSLRLPRRRQGLRRASPESPGIGSPPASELRSTAPPPRGPWSAPG